SRDRRARDPPSSREPRAAAERRGAPLLVPPLEPAARRDRRYGGRPRMSRTCVLGAGSWGTTLAVHLAELGHDVAIWGNVRSELEAMERDRENRKFLAGIPLPDRIKVQPELEAAVRGADLTVFVVPSVAVREVGEAV